MTTAISIHDVVKIRVSKVRIHGTEDSGFVTRDIVITKKDGTEVEITMFGKQDDDDGNTLEIGF